MPALSSDQKVKRISLLHANPLAAGNLRLVLGFLYITKKEIMSQEQAERIIELEVRLAAAIADKDCWVFNAKTLQKGYNELDARLRNREPIIYRSTKGLPSYVTKEYYESVHSSHPECWEALYR